MGMEAADCSVALDALSDFDIRRGGHQGKDQGTATMGPLVLAVGMREEILLRGTWKDCCAQNAVGMGHETTERCAWAGEDQVQARGGFPGALCRFLGHGGKHGGRGCPGQYETLAHVAASISP